MYSYVYIYNNDNINIFKSFQTCYLYYLYKFFRAMDFLTLFCFLAISQSYFQLYDFLPCM